MFDLCWKVLLLGLLAICCFTFYQSVKLENVCMCMCVSTELKADLMGSVVVELSHGSVTHHRTLGSHDSLIIWGIVWSLSIIKTNHRPAACRLSIIVCLRIIWLAQLSVIQGLCQFVCVCTFVWCSVCVSFCLFVSLCLFLFDLSALLVYVPLSILWRFLKAQQNIMFYP